MKFDLKVEGGLVLLQLTVDGRTVVLQLEPEPAKVIGGLLYRGGLKAEEYTQAMRIAADSGLLMRVGAPFTLTNNPRILDEAKKICEHDRTLRRALPGIKSEAVVGTPSVIGGTPWK